MSARRWTVESDHVLAEYVPAEPGAVCAFYTDLMNIGLVHPLVASVRLAEVRRPGGGELRTYRIRDRIPLGPANLRTSYTATVYTALDGSVLTEARQFPGVRLFGSVTFDPCDEGTTLTERLHITAPAALASFTARQAVAAHTGMLAGISRYFQSG